MTNKDTMHFPFSAQKATEVAAQFLLRSNRSINIMKLVKLVYLLDRESIGLRGVPVVGGAYLSMANGPVTSEILDLINVGSLWNRETNWERFISDRQDHQIVLTSDPGTDHLSEFELDLIAQIDAEHGRKDQYALRDWCHAHCGEWLPLEKGRADISLSTLADEVGADPSAVLNNAVEQSFLDDVFSK